MTCTRNAGEPTGDVALATSLIMGLTGGPVMEPGGDADPAEQVRAAAGRADPGELIQGLGTVLTACMGLLEDPGRAVPPVVSGLAARGLVAGDQLPTMGGVLTAAAVGQPPVRWRRGLGPIPGSEFPAWAYTAWLLADLTEQATGPGAITGLASRLGA